MVKVKKLVLLIFGRATARVKAPKVEIQINVSDLTSSRLSYGAIQWLRRQ